MPRKLLDFSGNTPAVVLVRTVKNLPLKGKTVGWDVYFVCVCLCVLIFHFSLMPLSAANIFRTDFFFSPYFSFLRLGSCSIWPYSQT